MKRGVSGQRRAATPRRSRSSQVEGELRELRCHYGNTLYRILYWRSDNPFVLLRHPREAHGSGNLGGVMVDNGSGRAVSEWLIDFRLGRIRSRFANHPILGSRMWE